MSALRSRGRPGSAGACHRARVRATRWLVRDDSGGFSIQISNSRLHSRGTKRPRLADSFGPKQRAQGMPGARRARSLACKIKKHTSIVTTVTPGSPGIPRTMVLTVSFVLFPVTGLVCHRRQRKYFRRLDASVGASEPHDFAVHLT